VAVPCLETWEAETAASWARCQAYTFERIPNASFMLVQEQGTILSNMRSNLARGALERGATHILWLDTDMVFPADTLMRLLSHKKPIVAANYSSRRWPCEPVAKELDTLHWIYTDHMSTGLQAAVACGMGLMLTETSVFTALPEPWFQVLPPDKEDGKQGRAVGEDFFFCYYAYNQLGIHPWIDHDLSKMIGHVGKFIYSFEEPLRDRPLMRLVKNNLMKRPDNLLPEDRFADLVDLHKRHSKEELERRMKDYDEWMAEKERVEEASWLQGLNQEA